MTYRWHIHAVSFGYRVPVDGAALGSDDGSGWPPASSCPHGSKSRPSAAHTKHFSLDSDKEGEILQKGNWSMMHHQEKAAERGPKVQVND
jgi:hypothetical protein